MLNKNNFECEIQFDMEFINAVSALKIHYLNAK